MNHNDYLESIKNVPVPENMEFGLAIIWLHPSTLPLRVMSIGADAPAIVRVPALVRNCYGNKVPVIAVSESAFAGREDITDIILPSTVHSLPDGVFAGCRALKNVTLSRYVRRIGEETFLGCDSLENIYYEGTPEEWDKVEIVHFKHEIEFGELVPGTPVQSVIAERRRYVPGNEAVFSANIHFRCRLEDIEGDPSFHIFARGTEITNLFACG